MSSLGVFRVLIAASLALSLAFFPSCRNTSAETGSGESTGTGVNSGEGESELEANRDFSAGPGYMEGITTSTERNKRDHEIDWYDWGDEPFEKAKEEGKLVLLDLTAPWCHWCHVMDETTYSTPEVIDFINENLIAVRVDADQHPAVEKAYISGGWPTTALLQHDRMKLAGVTYIPPDGMIDWLKQVMDSYEEQKEDIEGRIAAFKAGYTANIEAGVPGGETPEISELGKSIVDSMLSGFDSEYGGFGASGQDYAPKFPQPTVIEMLIRENGGENTGGMLEKTLKGQLGILDPVWGGFYRYSTDREWKTPHYEKMLRDQAALLRNYLHYWQWKDEDWALDAVKEIVRYVDDWLTGDDWQFWASQDADVGSHDADALFITGEEYFHLGDEERRKLGLPYVDTDVIADWASDMAAAYIEYGTVLESEGEVEKGLSALEGIWDNLRTEGGWLRHSLRRTSQEDPVLGDQVAFGRAALVAHAATGGESWLVRAVDIADVLLDKFEDKKSGGFFFVPFSENQVGNLLFLGKPFEENSVASLFLAELYHATGEQRFHDAAETALEALSAEVENYGFTAAGYYLALSTLKGETPKLVVVYPRDAPPTMEITRRIFNVYSPGKVVRYLPVDGDGASLGDLTFPSKDTTLVYPCKGNVCFSPVEAGSDDFEGELLRLLGGG